MEYLHENHFVVFDFTFHKNQLIYNCLRCKVHREQSIYDFIIHLYDKCSYPWNTPHCCMKYCKLESDYITETFVKIFLN